MMRRVFLLEDESLLRELVRSYIEEFEDVEIVGTSGDGADAMKQILELEPDIVLADIRVPEVSGLEVLYLLKRKLPDTKVVIFTGSTTADAVRLAYDGGADAFVEKNAGLGEFLRAFEAVEAGKRYFGPKIQETLRMLKGPDVVIE